MYGFKFLFFSAVLFTASKSFSQGNDCASATPLTVNTSCVNEPFSNDENGTNPEYVASCAVSGSSYEDVWYTITGTGNPITVTVSGTDRAYALSVLTSCTGGELGCTQQATGATGSVTFPSTAGTTYYVHIQRRDGTNSNNMSGNICAYDPLYVPPAACTDMTINTTTYSQNNLTTCGFGDDYSSLDACGSSYMNGDDIVIAYTPTTTGCVSIELTNTGSWVGIFVTDDCPDAAGVTCIASATASGGNPTLSGLNVTAGTTYYLTVSTFPSPQCTNFDLDIIACPPPPANDDCAGATPVTVNPDLNCGSTTAGTIQNATASSQSTTACSGTEDDDVWFSFVATSTSHTIDLLNVTGSTTDLYHSVWSGTCPTLSLVTGSCSDPNSSTVTGLTPGQTYFIRVYSWTSTPGQTTSFDVCVGTTPPPGPCTGDMAINSTLFSGSGYTTCGFGDDYSSLDACGSSYMGGDDIVIEYTPTNSQCVQIALSNTGTWVGLFVTDGCPDDPGTTCIAQATNSSGNPILNGLNVVAGTTYFITVSTFPSPQCTAFDIDISACPPPPANDECSNAQSVPVTPQGGTCSPTSGYTTNSTASAQANGCFGTADDDVWYSFVATSGDVQIDLSNISGSTTDMYFAVYGGTCGAPGAELLCSDPNSGQVSGLTIGNTYFIRVYTYTSTGGQSTSFDICVGEIGPCGIVSASEDYCPYPATLTQGPGSWTSTTYDYYTADTPANSGTLFCGSVENNSWYEFTALSTTETFNFTSVTSCTWGDGVQAEVYEVTYDASGCCSAFTSMSNCMNPGIAQPGTVTANGLTIGNQYILMVDGWGGDNCAFTVSGWTAQGIILSVELVDLGAIQRETENVIYWKTSSEKDNDYFEVQRSFDGIVYSTIGTIEGQGTTQDETDYWFPDTDVRNGKVYYRLVQYDFDGMKQTSQVITLNRNMTTVGMQSIYPNPAGDAAFVEVNLKTLVGNATLTVKSTEGKVVYSSVLKSETTDLIHKLDLKHYSQGVYLITLTDDDGFVQTQKLIKQ